MAALIVVAGLLAALIAGPRLGTPAGSPPRASTPAFEVQGGWRPVAWSPDGTRLLVAVGDAMGLVGIAAAPPALTGVIAAAWMPPVGHVLAAVRAASGMPATSTLTLLDGSATPTVLPIGSPSVVTWAGGGSAWAIAGSTEVIVGRPRAGVSEDLVRLGPPIALSPDGEELAARDPSTGGLVIARLADGTSRPIAGTSIDVSGRLAFSPDGRWLALADATGGLRLLPAAGSAPPTPLATGIDPASLAWSPDGHYLAVVRQPDGSQGSSIELLTVGSTAATVRTLGAGATFSWRPDGRAVLSIGPDGRLTAVPLTAGATPELLASDADPACAPAANRAGDLAYCTAGGLLRISGP